MQENFHYKGRPAPPNDSIPRMLKDALEHHRAGRLAEAAAIYRDILDIDGQNADSLHLLGMIEHQHGNHERGVELIRRAISIHPAEAAFHSNLGTILQAQHQLEEAAACFERALRLKPGWAELHTNLGNVLQTQGRLEEAAAHQQQALALKPTLAEAWSNLGNVRSAQGNIEEAEACYKRALAINPNYPDAQNNVGTVLLAQDQIDAAVAHFTRALELSPNFASAHNNLGNALLRLDRTDEAQAHYQRALALKPDYANAHNNLANVLKEQGKFTGALAHYDRAIALNPNYAEAHLNRAEMTTFHRDGADFAALESLLAQTGLPSDKSLYVHFALGKALDDIGDYARAFEHFHQGNALKRAQIHYDEPAILQMFQRMSNVFDAALLERSHAQCDSPTVPIFVVGMPRSGSTLVEQILAGHPQIHAAGELTILEKMEANGLFNASGSQLSYPESVPALDVPTLQHLGQTYLSRQPRVDGGKTRIVDKLPGNFLRLGLIRLMLLNARFIHTTRHPLDTCLSCYSKLFTNGLPFTYDLSELGRYYRAYLELMDHWHAVLPAGALLDVSYEDVVDGLEIQARRIIRFCGLPWDERCLGFHKSKRPVRTASAVQVRQPLFRSSVGRWRNYEANLAPLLEALQARL